MNCGICDYHNTQTIGDSVRYCTQCGAIYFDLAQHGIKSQWHSTSLWDRVLFAETVGWDDYARDSVLNIIPKRFHHP